MDQSLPSTTQKSEGTKTMSSSNNNRFGRRIIFISAFISVQGFFYFCNWNMLSITDFTTTSNYNVFVEQPKIQISIDATCSDDVDNYECNSMMNDNNADPSLYSAESLQRSKDEIIPIWMVEYLEWHAQQRNNITENTKFLVVRCLRNERCGGLSDRYIIIWP